MITFKVVGVNFKDGNLAERMQGEGLPITLTSHNKKNEGLTFECSPELLKAMASSGLDFELIEGDNPFEGVSNTEKPGGYRKFSYGRKGTQINGTRKPRS